MLMNWQWRLLVDEIQLMGQSSIYLKFILKCHAAGPIISTLDPWMDSFAVLWSLLKLALKCWTKRVPYYLIVENSIVQFKAFVRL